MDFIFFAVGIAQECRIEGFMLVSFS